MNTRKTGAFYEGAACDYLTRQGIVILERNFACRQGEVDIIARQKDCVIFLEVKYRRTNAFGDALLAVSFRKQKKICRCAEYYCMKHPWVTHFRYDVIAINDTQIKWIQNAFDHIGEHWN